MTYFVATIYFFRKSIDKKYTFLEKVKSKNGKKSDISFYI